MYEYNTILVFSKDNLIPYKSTDYFIILIEWHHMNVVASENHRKPDCILFNTFSFRLSIKMSLQVCEENFRDENFWIHIEIWF